ncbi:hypothetical protein ENH_00017930 [Eimeria necatrix]|uniref:Uncharacterized protein n=1 Tax=Eimeria necatrix TaxID=51315 RepID=U6MUZ7_9EIME|nr:hypothetical protein ENH_00017930 [Eimeria necatrix]CDJ66284.1 hypothetical protein ENH_00017930 [Eimeria necatrix]
MGVFISYVR